ncbi:MAG TPA: LUD domain-containing protein [Patescibacteria group bacterium]
MDIWNELASDEVINLTSTALNNHGIKTVVVNTAAEAKNAVLDLIPPQSQVMTATSQTLEAAGLNHEINDTDRYNSVKKQLSSMDRATQSQEMQQLGAAPVWVVGSVHAVTQLGQVVIASKTGSQLPAYAYGAAHVVWVVSTKKIVLNLDAAYKRIYEYTLPLENERAMKAYGMGSSVNKILVINEEVQPDRIRIIFVKEDLGF